MPFILVLFDYVTERKWYHRVKWVSSIDFKIFVMALDLSTEIVDDNICDSIYNLSIQTQMDEVNNDRHVRMNLNEFIEALARLAERLSPCFIGKHIDQFDLISRQIVPLHVKMESLLCFINKKIKKKTFEKFFDIFSPDNPFNSIPRAHSITNMGEVQINQSLVLQIAYHGHEV